MADPRIRMSGIYAIRNTISGRVYVGSGGKIARRWKSHRHLLRAGVHHSRSMQRSWDKHGEGAFEFSVLELVPDQALLIEREQHWIDALSAADPKTGFNMSPTAGNCSGVIHTEETRALWSSQRKGVPKAPEHRLAIGAAQIGKIISEAQRLLAAEATRLHFQNNPAARERMREVGRRNGALSKGRKASAETRARSSEMRLSDPKFAAIGLANLAKVTPEGRARGAQKIREKLAGRPNIWRRKLTFADAEEIRRLKVLGFTYDQLEALTETDRSSLYSIVTRKMYIAPSAADLPEDANGEALFSWDADDRPFSAFEGVCSNLVKGDTRNFGERNGHFSMPVETIREVRRLYETGEWSQTSIAKHLGIGQSNVSRCILGRARGGLPADLSSPMETNKQLKRHSSGLSANLLEIQNTP